MSRGYRRRSSWGSHRIFAGFVGAWLLAIACGSNPEIATKPKIVDGGAQLGERESFRPRPVSR